MILKIIKKLSIIGVKPPTPNGRWSILESNRALQRRIDMANIDHCGPCSFDELKKDKTNYLITSGHEVNNKVS